MKQMHILIVEDESIVAMEIESYLKTLGHHINGVFSHANGALETLKNEHIDLIMMDICIKGEIDGVEAAAIIKEKYPQTEIIFLTAHMDDYNIERAIQIDPVAYLSKPFNREELKAFLRIAEHRMENTTQLHISTDSLVKLDEEYIYDTQTHTLYCCSEPMHLTKKEDQLLNLLLLNQNLVVDFYTIENTIWPDKTTNANTVRTLIRRLREKLKHKFIKTVSTRGYIFHTAYIA
jgi:DNA-binding response OmpR family regulator